MPSLPHRSVASRRRTRFWRAMRRFLTPLRANCATLLHRGRRRPPQRVDPSFASAGACAGPRFRREFVSRPFAPARAGRQHPFAAKRAYFGHPVHEDSCRSGCSPGSRARACVDADADDCSGQRRAPRAVARRLAQARRSRASSRALHGGGGGGGALLDPVVVPRRRDASTRVDESHALAHRDARGAPPPGP